MAILANRSTPIIVQGITGREGSFYTRQMIDYGTQIVGGVTPGKGGEWIHGKPVFDTVTKAIDATGANTSIIFAPSAAAVDAIYEAVDADIELIICVTEGIPVLDMMRIRSYLQYRNVRLIGPNCPGIITPNQANLGIIPGYVSVPGNIGVVSRSGTLTYDIIYSMTRKGLGQTTCVGIGNDTVLGTDYVAILHLFEDDPETEVIVLIGENSGQMEIEAAEYIKAFMTKPVVAYISGKTMPTDVLRTHAGKTTTHTLPTAHHKIESLLNAGVRVADHPEQIPVLIQNLGT